jgi:hypothetical protein
MCVPPVKKYGLLDQPLAANLGHEINVFLGAPSAYGDVMNALD